MNLSKLAKWSITPLYSNRAFILGWDINFNKRGKDGFARATINSSDKSLVWGVLHQISYEDKNKLDEMEALGKGYKAQLVNVKQENESSLSAHAYVGIKLAKGLQIQKWYQEAIIDGAKEAGLPNEYINYLTSKMPVMAR